MKIRLGWRLSYSQSMVVVMGRALNVRGSEIVFEEDLRLRLSDLLGGANSAVEGLPNDLGSLGLPQKGHVTGRRNRHVHRKA